MVGTGMLWVGWHGFNAGSAVAADGIAANAFMTTTLSTAVACFTWAAAEWVVKGRPSVPGFCSGAVAGMVVVTPACGFITASGAIIIGIAAGLIPFFAVTKLKRLIGYDDALDTFGVHAVGGTLGVLLTGFLAALDVNANLSTNLKAVVGSSLWIEQVKAIGRAQLDTRAKSRKGRSRIARRFNAGWAGNEGQAPSGAAESDSCNAAFCRPYGTLPSRAAFPALKCRAILVHPSGT